MSVTAAQYLTNEDGIVWLEDIAHLDYAREDISLQPFRRRKPGRGYPGRLVGYATLSAQAEAEDHRFFRRVFWLAPHDRDAGHLCYRRTAPTEAVDPRTVRPGVPGRLTKRAWEGRKEGGQ
jgi:hypothetical protein